MLKRRHVCSPFYTECDGGLNGDAAALSSVFFRQCDAPRRSLPPSTGDPAVDGVDE